MNEYPDNPLQKIWQGQPVQGLKMSPDEIRKRAGKLENRILWRNVGEYLGALVAAALLGSDFVKTHDTLFRLAFGLFIAGLAYVTFHLHRKGSARSLPAELGSATCLEFHRRELERQRDLVANVWPWYLGPLVPGFAVYAVAYALAFPHLANLGGLAVLEAFTAAVFILIWKLNQRAARSLQRRIDELYSAENPR